MPSAIKSVRRPHDSANSRMQLVLPAARRLLQARLRPAFKALQVERLSKLPAALFSETAALGPDAIVDDMLSAEKLDVVWGIRTCCT
jgi:hypothetical protein